MSPSRSVVHPASPWSGVIGAFAVLAAGLLCSGGAHAACESGLAERMHRRLYAERPLDHALAACKAWPAFPGRSIVVLPMPQQPGTEPGRRVFDLAVLIIQRPDNGNTERDAVMSLSYQRAALRENGAMLQDVRIDTGRYVLAPNQRAFGLRARYRGDALAAPFSNETLRLYLAQGKGIDEILAETEIERDSGRWDLQCEGRFERLRTQISVERTDRNRWPDLVLARTLLPNHTVLQADGQCVDQASPPRNTPLRLKPDGKAYPAPPPIKPSF